MANPTTNYSFAMPTNTDLVKDLPADFEVFGQAVDTQMKTNADAAIAKSLVTTKGDLIAATGASTPARLAIGTNDQVLTADSTASTGMAWKTSASGGMTLLSTTSLSGTSVTISSISQSYTNLLILVRGATAASAFRLRIQANASSTECIVGGYDAPGGGTVTGQNGTMALYGETQAHAHLLLHDYANTSQRKTGIGGHNTTGNVNGTIGYFYNNTSAISSILVGNQAGVTFTAGQVLIYGVK